MQNLKRHYSKSLFPGVLHFAAHSHHPRPNVTLKATKRCWYDAARMMDYKWEHILESVIPTAQCNIAQLLDVSHPHNIAFASNTHEFVARILSSFDARKPVRILTTANEFHSFSRQVRRFAERHNVYVTEIPVFPHGNFVSRFKQQLEMSEFDLVFFSQVFYDSGFRLRNADVENIVAAVKSTETVIVIDGYHGFCAVPTSLAMIQDRVFYLAGGYKYAQWGEGACFLYIPPSGMKLRPENTGWFAEFGKLSGSAESGRTEYSDDAFRFWGATFDPAGLYRLNSVCEWMREEEITPDAIRGHALSLQTYFLDQLIVRGSESFWRDNLVTPQRGSELHMRGNFLSFEQKSESEAQAIVRTLCEQNVIVDARGSFVRVGFGVYQDRGDVESLLKIISKLEDVHVD